MNININSTNFQAKYETSKVLEVTTRKIFDPDGVSGYIDTLKKIHGNVPRYTGHQGYRRYAEIVSEKILAKYPEIKKATDAILKITEQNPNILPKELREEVKPILSEMNKTVDIEI